MDQRIVDFQSRFSSGGTPEATGRRPVPPCASSRQRTGLAVIKAREISCPNCTPVLARATVAELNSIRMNSTSTLRFRSVTVLVLAATMRAAGAAETAGWTTADDHKNMMEQLAITRLRPGPSGRVGATNSANYDPAQANPFPDFPDPLVLKNGRKVTTPELWWKERRPEIVEDFEREVLGRVPKNVPKVTWTVTTQATDRVIGDLPVIAKQLVGHVDNSGYPAINVDIQMTLVTPAKATRPVPVLMMFGGFFGGTGLPRRAGEPAPTNRFGAFGGGGGGTNAGPGSTAQLIAEAWG